MKTISNRPKLKQVAIACNAILIASSFLITGCSNGGSDGSSGGNTLNVDVASSVPSSVVSGNQAILDAAVSVDGSQVANGALFTLGADASNALAMITAINYPNVSGVDFTQIIPNGTELPDCTVGLSLSNAQPACMLKVSIEGESGKNVDDDIDVVTDVQTLPIAVKTSFVNTGSTSLPQGQVSPAPIVAPDTSVQVKVNNSQANTESFNNLHVTLPSWLADIATNLVGGTVSTNGDGNTVITYTVNGANVNLAPGQTHTFSFDLGGDQTTVDTLLDHYDELIDNSDSDVIVVNAANLRNPLTPDLTVSLTPASMSPEEITLNDPDEPQTITVRNLSNSQLQITVIDDSNLPEGVEIDDDTTCSTTPGEYIEPAGDAGDSCTVQLSVEIDAVPEDNKTLVIEYKDPQNNIFEDSTEVNIGGAEIIINNFGSIELPVDGDQTTDVTITNMGALNWLPSAQPESYEITKENESTAAANISVTIGSGTDCLAGAAVAPGLSCNIGIETTAGNADPDDDTAEGSYVLNVLPSNDGNLEAPVPKIFNVTEPTLGSFQFQNEDGGPIDTQNFEIGDSPITIQVANVGAIAITGFDLAIPGKFTQANNTCAALADDTLAADASCSVDLSVDNGTGIGLGTYDIQATGDAESVSNSPQILEATVQGAVVTFLPNQISIPLPIGEDPTEAVITITNDGENTIVWQPSDDINDYRISAPLGGDTTGISVVNDPEQENACDTIGAPIAVGNTCVVSIQVDDTATEGTYTLTLNLANNLAAAQPKNFEVTGTLGYFSFSPLSITIGTDSTNQRQEITLSNMGDTDITNVYLIQDPEDLTITNNNCGEADDKLDVLLSGENCTFEIAANNEVGQGETVAIIANGDENTVENNEAEFETFINGVVVQIESINDDEAINRPAAGPQTTNVELTNLGNEAWIPATTAAGYQISRVDGVPTANISVVNGASGDEDPIENCWSVENVAVGGSCYIGIQTNANTPETAYTLRVLAQAASPNTIPQASEQQPFTIDESLGYFTYSGDGIDNDELTLTIGDDPVTIILTNIGDTEITAVALNTGDDANKFDVTNSGTCDDQTLAASIGSCTFDLALSGTAVADADYTFATTGTNASNSPAELTVTAESGCTPITVGNYEWAPDANLGVAAYAAVVGVDMNGAMDLDTATGDFITWLNNANYCDHNDWKIPSMAQYGCTEAFGTCDRAVAGGLLSSGWNGVGSLFDYLTGLGFTNVQSFFYWSGTEGGDGGAWYLYFDNGDVDYDGKFNGNYVLPVRTPLRFVAYENTACLLDTETGLVWYNAGNDYNGDWNSLNTQFPQNGNGSDELCGQTGWKMPTLAEYGCDASAGACSYNAGGLITGWDAAGACGGEDCDDPADYLNSNGFTAVQFNDYWSGTESDSDNAWALFMSDGNVFSDDKGSDYFVLPVRSAW